VLLYSHRSPGAVVLDALVEVEAPLLGELQYDDGREGLRVAGDADAAVDRDPAIGAEVAHPGGVVADPAVDAANRGERGREPVLVDEGLEALPNFGFAARPRRRPAGVR